jgi:glutaredoxin
MRTAVLLPLTALSLVVAVAALGFRAGRRRGFGPFAVGVVAAVVLVIGKFAIDSDVMVYGGIVGLVGVSLWNSWPTRPTASVPSAPSGTLYQIGSSVKGFVMTTKRKIEVFSAGCPACQDTVALVQRVACPSCDVSVLDMNDQGVASRARSLGIRSVPAVVIDGKLADCCTGRGPDESALRSAGLGVA